MVRMVANLIAADGVRTHDVNTLLTSVWIDQAASALRIISAVLAILLIQHINKNQDERFERISQATEEQSNIPPILPNFG